MHTAHAHARQNTTSHAKPSGFGTQFVYTSVRSLMLWQYDVENAFLISAKFAWTHWGKHISKADIRNYLLETLVNAG